MAYQTTQKFLGSNWAGKNFGLLLCPTEVVGGWVCDLSGRPVKGQKEEEGEERERGKGWLCAIVLPAVLPGTYSVNLWRQVVVREEEMDEEVLMEYDEASRFFYMTV